MRKYLLGFATFVLAFVILSISVFESASPKYAFSTPSPVATTLGVEVKEVEYQLPYQGKVGPDSPFWFFKALRDKIWYVVTLDSSKKADLNLLYADKRLAFSKDLFNSQKPELAFSTLTKAEKYLELASNEEMKARSGGEDTTEFLTKLATSALKHRQVIHEILKIAPEDAKPEIVRIEDYSINVYKSSRDALNSKGKESPINPFDGE